MQISITARHFELAQDDRHFAEARLEKFRRFASDIHEVRLVVTSEDHRYVAEISVRLKQRDLAVREEAMEPRPAIERLADRVEAQLRRIHDKRADHKRAPGAAGIAEPEAAADDELADGGQG